MSKLVKTSLGSFYFTADLNTLQDISSRKPIESKPIVAVNLSTNTRYTYSSVTKAEKSLKIHHDFINKHLDRSIYVSQDGRRFKFTSG
ncbi:MAG: hypothetical protein EOO61_13805 [Hymenobacter sp.]|nr:MAG: hypothetical protein EOO61_13805 [Hymenobacter sp.]